MTELDDVEAAITEDIEAWDPEPIELPGGRTTMPPSHEAFTREHVESMRLAGATRAEAREYAETFLTTVQVAQVVADLDSYGEWSGD